MATLTKVSFGPAAVLFGTPALPPQFSWSVAEGAALDFAAGVASAIEIARNVPAGYQIVPTPALPTGVSITIDQAGTAALAIAANAPEVTTGAIVLADPAPPWTLPSFQIIPEASGTNVPFTAGLVLPDVGPVGVRANLPNTQAVALSSYASGRPHHVAVQGRLAAVTQDVPVTVQLLAGANAAGNVVTLAALTTAVKQSISIALTNVALKTADVTGVTGFVRAPSVGQSISAGGEASLTTDQYSVVPAGNVSIPGGSTYYGWLCGGSGAQAQADGGTGEWSGPWRVAQGSSAQKVAFPDGCDDTSLWIQTDRSQRVFRAFTKQIAAPASRSLNDATLDTILWTGPEACVARYWDATPFAGTAIRAEWYVRVHADGQIEVTPILHNGAIDEAAATATQYTATLTIGGQQRAQTAERSDTWGKPCPSGTAVMHLPYERVHLDSHYVAAATPAVRLVHDQAHWTSVGVMPPVDPTAMESPTLRSAPATGYAPGLSWYSPECSTLGAFEQTPNSGGIRRGWSVLSLEEINWMARGTQISWRAMLACAKGWRPSPHVFRLAATGKRPDLSAAPYATKGFGMFAASADLPTCGAPTAFRIGRYNGGGQYTDPIDFEHASTPGVLAYLATARPDLADPVLDMTTAGFLSITAAARGNGNCEIRRTPTNTQADMYQERATGLGMRNVASCVLATRDGSPEKALWSNVLARNFDVRGAHGLKGPGVPPMITDNPVCQDAWLPPSYVGANKGPWCLPWQYAMGAFSMGWMRAQSYLAEKGGASFALIADAYLDTAVALWGDGTSAPHYLSTASYRAWMLGPDAVTLGYSSQGFILFTSNMDTTWAQVASRNAAYYPVPASLTDNTYGGEPHTITPERRCMHWPGLVYAATLSRPGASAALGRAKADSAFAAWRSTKLVGATMDCMNLWA